MKYTHRKVGGRERKREESKCVKNINRELSHKLHADGCSLYYFYVNSKLSSKLKLKKKKKSAKAAFNDQLAGIILQIWEEAPSPQLGDLMGLVSLTWCIISYLLLC